MEYNIIICHIIHILYIFYSITVVFQNWFHHTYDVELKWTHVPGVGSSRSLRRVTGQGPRGNGCCPRSLLCSGPAPRSPPPAPSSASSLPRTSPRAFRILRVECVHPHWWRCKMEGGRIIIFFLKSFFGHRRPILFFASGLPQITGNFSPKN